MAGLTPVIRSHCRVWLLRKILSLYSSDTLIEGVSVPPRRWGGGARSPNSSSGYAAGGGPGLGLLERAPAPVAVRAGPQVEVPDPTLGTRSNRRQARQSHQRLRRLAKATRTPTYPQGLAFAEIELSCTV